MALTWDQEAGKVSTLSATTKILAIDQRQATGSSWFARSVNTSITSSHRFAPRHLISSPSKCLYFVSKPVWHCFSGTRRFCNYSSGLVIVVRKGRVESYAFVRIKTENSRFESRNLPLIWLSLCDVGTNVVRESSGLLPALGSREANDCWTRIIHLFEREREG